MTHYAYQTRAQEFFEGATVTLHEYEGEERSYITLYVDYGFDEKAILISIYDDTKRGRVEDFLFTSVADVETTLRALDEKYPGKIDVSDVLFRVKAFFAVADNVVIINSDLTEAEEYSCGVCGDYNGDAYEFQFLPSIPETDITEPSLYLHYDYGCYGGEKFFGSFNDVRAEVLELLESMRSQAKGSLVDDVNRAIQTVKDNTSE